MRLSLLRFILSNLLLLFIIFVDSANSSTSCQRRCGEMNISYPFGIGEGCYLEKWYEIECVNNNTAILSALGKEVANISLLDEGFYNSQINYSGSMRIKNSIISQGCSHYTEEEGDSLLNFSGSPFVVSDHNTLVVIGCNCTAFLTNKEPSLVGCISTCHTANSLPSIGEDDYKGSGICHASLAVSQPVVGVRIDNNTRIMTTTPARRECKVAFLTEPTYPTYLLGRNSKQIHAQGYSWVQVSWFIYSKNLSFLHSLGCENINNYQYTDSEASCLYKYNVDSGYAITTCSPRFTGNPVILGGCKDINECLDKTLCPETTTCVNLHGDFKCVHNKALLVVIAFGAGFGLLILIAGIYWLVKFIKRRKKINRKRKHFKRNGGLLLQQQLISTERNVEKTRIFSSKELENATENFSLNRMLGQGGQGTVYKGMLVDGGIVAVKKSIVVDEDKLEEFINEVVILSQINHRNIVKLLGCCLETEVPILVYEFIPNGNLFEHLHEDPENATFTTWKVRLRIAVDIAGALSYLHSAASFPIFHRDIKTSNIMLDAKYRAKVSDFGTLRSVTLDHTHLTTVVSGTVGYLDPEYFQSSQFTDKSDVYSFGVVLLELITGAKPFSFLRSQENRALAAYFIDAMKENKLEEMVDARIRDDCKMEQVMATAKLARSCLNWKGKNRPSMREVSTELERIRSSETNLEAQVFIVESDEEEHVHIEVETWNDVGVAAASTSSFEVATTSFMDAQPLFPHQTW